MERLGILSAILENFLVSLKRYQMRNRILIFFERVKTALFIRNNFSMFVFEKPL